MVGGLRNGLFRRDALQKTGNARQSLRVREGCLIGEVSMIRRDGVGFPEMALSQMSSFGASSYIDSAMRQQEVHRPPRNPVRLFIQPEQALLKAHIEPFGHANLSIRERIVCTL